MKKSLAIEIKSITSDGRFAGYASVFGNVDAQRDVVRKGAFLRSLTSRVEPLRLLWQHLWNEPIGVIERVFEDAHGLYVEGRLALEVARAREALSLMKSGIVRGLSIGYTVQRYRRNPDTGVRELLEIDLWEVSLVTVPANHAAQVTVIKQDAAPDKLQLIAALKRARNQLMIL